MCSSERFAQEIAVRKGEELLRLEEAGVSATVDVKRGGRLVSFEVGGRELLGHGEPVIGLPRDIFDGCFVMAPFAGRLPSGRFSFAGRDFQVLVNAQQHAIHGLVFDRPWEVVSPSRIVVDLDERWPFGGRVEQSFALSLGSLKVQVAVYNERRAMPAAVGFHPWFAERIGTAVAELDVQPLSRQIVDERGVPTGFARGAGARPWNTCFRGMANTPKVRWPGELSLTVQSAAAEWVVCETVPGGVCVEPLSGPVGELATTRCSIVSPGHPLVLEMVLSWSSES